MNRVKTGLGLLATGAALTLALATPASAGPASDGAGSKTSGSTANQAPDRAVPAAAIRTGHATPASKAPRTAAAAGVGGTGVVTAGHQDAACDVYSPGGDGDFCLWFLSNFVGSYSDFFFADTNLTDNTFLTAGSGQGQTVAANAESDLNADSNLTARVCTGVGQTGSCNIVPPHGFGNFIAPWFNGVRSFLWE
jgi:hypothetical protein